MRAAVPLVSRALYLALGLATGLTLAGHDAVPGVIAQVVRSSCPPLSKAAPPIHLTSAHHPVSVKLGDTLWKLTLTGVAVRSSIHSDLGNATAKGKFIVVYLTAQNLGTKPSEVAMDDNSVLLDAQGRSFSRNIEASSDAATVAHLDPYEEVQPTFITHVAFVYDVPVTAHGFVFAEIANYGFGQTDKIFTLGL